MSQSKLPDPAGWQHRPQRLYEILAADPPVGDAFDVYGRSLNQLLPPRMLELIALRIATLRDCDYMWRGHVLIALNHPVDPLTEAEIAAVAAGPDALSGDDARIVRAIDEVAIHRSGRRHVAALGDDALGVVLATFFYEAVTALLHHVEPEEQALPVPGLETPAIAARRLDRRLPHAS
jgi:alkylhydroperoxidase family enzyme